MKTPSTRKTWAYLLGAVLAFGSAIGATTASAAEEAEAKIVIPTTIEAIWSAIDKETQTLAALIQAGTLDKVHVHAFAIRDLVRALPERSKTLTTEQLQKVRANVKFVDALAARLDESGDSNDKAGSASNLEKLQGVLKSIRSNYESK